MHSNKAVSKLCTAIITFTAQDTSLMWLQAGSYICTAQLAIQLGQCAYSYSYTLQNYYLNLTYVEVTTHSYMYSCNCMNVANIQSVSYVSSLVLIVLLVLASGTAGTSGTDGTSGAAGNL